MDAWCLLLRTRHVLSYNMQRSAIMAWHYVLDYKRKDLGLGGGFLHQSQISFNMAEKVTKNEIPNSYIRQRSATMAGQGTQGMGGTLRTTR